MSTDKTKRTATRYDGVLTRQVERNGKVDTAYIIDYYNAQGKRIRKTIGRKSQGMTVQVAAELRRRAMLDTAQPPITTAQSITVSDAWSAYAAYRAEYGKNINSTRSDTSSYSKHIAQPFGSLPLSELTLPLLQNFVTALSHKNLSPKTVCTTFGILRALCNHAQKSGLYAEALPFDRVRLPTVNNARIRYLTQSEIKKLLAELKKRSHTTYIIALLSLFCGLRFGEIVKLTRADIDFTAQTLFISDPKNGRQRHVALGKTILEILKDYSQLSLCDYLFTQKNGKPIEYISDTFARTVKKLGFNHNINDPRKKVVFHTLRHTYASYLALAGEQQKMIADCLGHTNLQMTNRYTHLMPEQKRRAAEKLDSIINL